PGTRRGRLHAARAPRRASAPSGSRRRRRPTPRSRGGSDTARAARRAVGRRASTRAPRLRAATRPRDRRSGSRRGRSPRRAPRRAGSRSFRRLHPPADDGRLGAAPAGDDADPSLIGIADDLRIGGRREERGPDLLLGVVAQLMRPRLAAWKEREVPRRHHTLSVRSAERRRAFEDEQPLLLACMPVVARGVTWCELVHRAAPPLRAERFADAPDLLEQVQKPVPSGTGRGLRGSPGCGPPALYSEGATSFGPSA